jgi:hypothetical protein
VPFAIRQLGLAGFDEVMKLGLRAGCINPERARSRSAEAALASGVPVFWRSPLFMSVVYVVVCRLLELVVLIGRG